DGQLCETAHKGAAHAENMNMHCGKLISEIGESLPLNADGQNVQVVARTRVRLRPAVIQAKTTRLSLVSVDVSSSPSLSLQYVGRKSAASSAIVLIGMTAEGAALFRPTRRTKKLQRG